MDETNEVIEDAVPDATELDRRSVFTADSFGRMCAGAQTRQEWSVTGLMKARSLNLLAGDSHLGKSPLAIQLGLCKAAGVPFLNYETAPAGRVLYCDFENDGSDFWRITETISDFLGLPEPPANFFGWSPYWDDRWTGQASAGPLESEVRKIIDLVKPELVVIDPLRVVHPLAMERPEALIEMVKTFRQLSRDHGCAFILIHHLRKEDRQAPGGRPSLEESGSRWFQEVHGLLALVNHVDGRFGVEEPRGDREADLIFGGYRRGTPSLSPHYIERVHDENGDPQGYRLMTGTDHIKEEWRDVFAQLGEQFRYTDAKRQVGNDHSTTRFLASFCQAGALDKLPSKQGYRKVETASTPDAQSTQSRHVTN